MHTFFGRMECQCDPIWCSYPTVSNKYKNHANTNQRLRQQNTVQQSSKKLAPESLGRTSTLQASLVVSEMVEP